MAKTLKRFFRDKRAITPVLSNLLLTVVAVAAMAVATTATYVITTNLKDIMSERLIVEDLWFSSPNEVSIYLYNIGKVSVHFSTVYINSMPFTTSFNLEPSGHGWLNISVSWSSGNVYHVDVVTSRGTHVGDHYKAP
jgi:Flp pilus assembly pilin Flp